MVKKADLISAIERLNGDDEVDGILVQLPITGPHRRT
ncbi:MAG: tetrahydrofolate dehydrogenase/cyclohydrolase catalytic domain-containing protein [Ferruginibacter sp.]